ncbi:hypothetical protein CRE_05071 [Caenorhabditis remanei]|uniref:Uncharacterized protein n=1 Tax=Caenorhabditis remanei TaxID=31234 RepID=E3MZ17_CAERE|nr:hypothetical protein CRE_05071 [Caenorhabditis remanei]
MGKIQLTTVEKIKFRQYYILEPGFEEMPENLEPDRKSKSGDVSMEQSPEFVHQRDEISEEEDLEEEEEYPTK